MVNASSAEIPGPRASDRSDSALPRTLKARRSCRVLIVDDDELARAAMAELLRTCRYDVEVAASGEEALQKLRSMRCDIVLTDWRMPGMDGLALCRQLRLMAHEAYIYIVMLSVRNGERDVLVALAAGADDYVVKGTSVDELLARLEIGRRITGSLRLPPVRIPASHDGAHDLQYLIRHLPREIARAQRYERALSVLECHLECHVEATAPSTPASAPTGIGLVRYFLERAAGCLRASDWCARTGPRDFMIVLPEASAQDAQRVAAKLQRRFARAQPAGTSTPPAFTVQIETRSVEAAYDAASYSSMYALLRAARDWQRTEEQLAPDPAAHDNVVYMDREHHDHHGHNGHHGDKAQAFQRTRRELD